MDHCNVPTPAFIIDLEELNSNVTGFQDALCRVWPNSIVGYSFKTNNLPWVCRYMKTKGCYAEVVSEDENISLLGS